MSMKKLQADIDRLLKKVSEGFETTEYLFDKIENSATNNLKDKYESDLKKEIKKLQRLRDQIKTFIASNDVKDKRALMENRKMIESQMERFKIVERDVKTKAFSKEGLLQKERLDPKHKEKADACDFVTNAVDELSRQIETDEFEIEQLEGTSSKRGNKKADQQRAERVEEMEHLNERRKYHINRLELILRLLENDHLEPDRINDLKEAVQYYVEYNHEPDFEEDEGLYDDLDLEKEEELYAIRTDEFYGKSDSENEADSEDHSTITTPPSKSISPKATKPSHTPQKVTASPVKVEEKPTASPVKAGTSPVKVEKVTSPVKDNAWVERPKIVEAEQKKPILSKSSELPPSLADLGTAFESVKNNHKNDTQYKNQMLNVSLQHVPDLIDSERPKIYQPRHPYNAPSYYPQQPLVIFDNPILYEKFDMDTLFYIFYYQQGTYQQYLAAKELKKQSWRFHKKYSTWFQRHEEPKEITEEYEQGTYVYFDYEGAWCQRKKTDFRFEYRFLEEA